MSNNQIVHPGRLAMRYVSSCDFCHREHNASVDVKKCPESHIFSLQDLYGWFYCDKCVDELRQNIINYCNEINGIPFFWLFGTEIKFYRISQTAIQSAKVTIDTNGICTYNPAVDTMMMHLEFGSDSSRLVRLENIFHHNPGLYERLKECKNLLKNDKMKIAYDELSPLTHEYIKKAFEKSTKPSDSYVQ